MFCRLLSPAMFRFMRQCGTAAEARSDTDTSIAYFKHRHLKISESLVQIFSSSQNRTVAECNCWFRSSFASRYSVIKFCMRPSPTITFPIIVQDI